MEKVRRISKRSCFRQIAACLLLYCLFFNASLVLAEVVMTSNPAGTIEVTPLNGGTTQGMTATDRAIGHFSDFDIIAGHTVTCTQPGPSANALFRVFSEDGTQIFGTFNANGGIWLIDAAGILIGSTGQINVPRLVASGLAMSDTVFKDVLAGVTKKMEFSGGDGPGIVAIDAGGTINATDSVYLVGRSIFNNGAILCPDGLVVMAAGSTVKLGLPGSNVIVDVQNLNTDLIADSSNRVENNGTVGGSSVDKLVLAAGDVWSTALDVGSLAAVANRNIRLDDDVTATGSVEVLGGQEPGKARIEIAGNITAASMRLKNGNDTNGEMSYSGIYVNDGKNLTATDGDVVVEAVHDIILSGNVEATGDIFLNADEDGYGDPRDQDLYNPMPYGGGDLMAHGTITAGGNVDILGNSIYLGDDVSANGGDLSITGRTSPESNNGTTLINDSIWGEIQVAEGKTLYAGKDVYIKDAGTSQEALGMMMLTGYESLAIVAGGADGVDDGEIFVENTTIRVESDTSLTLQQDESLNLGDDQWVFENQGSTDLTLISNESSVIAVDASHPLSGDDDNAADQWQSIGATAKGDIDLSGPGQITTRELLSHEGDITVESTGSYVDATEDITATLGSVSLTASCGISDAADIFAGTNVNINSNLTLLGCEWVWDDTASGWVFDYDSEDWDFVEGGAWVWQGNQYITAQNGTLTAEQWIHKYTPGELHMYGGSPDLAIDLKYLGYIYDSYGYPTVLTAGNLYMRANGDIQIAGDITGLGWWRSPGNVYQNYPWQQLFFETNYDGEPVLWPWAAGGVSIISEKGKIYTEPQVMPVANSVLLNGDNGNGYEPAPDDYWLRVAIEGYSDDVTHRSVLPEGAEEWYEGLMFQACLVWNAPLNEAAGVDLPYADGKAAIVLMSKEDLKLAGYPDLDGGDLDGGDLVNSVSGVLRTGASLTAYGRYAATEEFSLDGVDSWLEWEDYIYNVPHKYAGLVDLEALGDGFNAYAKEQGYVPETDFEDENIENRVDFAVFKGLVEDYLDSIGGFELTAVDDRPGVGFLDEPGVEIGGFIRNEGVPIDVAIYAASTENDVVIAENARITVEPGFPYQPVFAIENNYEEPRYEFDSGATVVLDAYDTVTVEGILDHLFQFEDLDGISSFTNELHNYFGDDIDLGGFDLAFTEYLITNNYIQEGTEVTEFKEWASANFDLFKELFVDFFIDYFKDFDFEGLLRVANFRLEACSRRTGTLGQAIDEGTLPFADTTWVMEWFLGDAYVLRGEGDLGITRAWVLDDNPVIIPEPEPEPEPEFEPIPPAPLYDITAVPGVERVGFGPAGCPALLVWLAGEIGVPEETIQIYVANTFAYSTDIQPCEMCARLKGAATTLQDPEGTAIAALGRVINEFVTTPAPPSPEQMASVATTLAEHTDDGTYYAAAGQWIDALVAYVTILNTEMRWSIDDSIALAMGKYGAPVTASGNASLVAYVQARLAPIGG